MGNIHKLQGPLPGVRMLGAALGPPQASGSVTRENEARRCPETCANGSRHIANVAFLDVLGGFSKCFGTFPAETLVDGLPQASS